MKHPGLLNQSNSFQPKKFEWTDENRRKINKIIEKYPKTRKQSAVIPVLDLAQRQNEGWLSQASIEKVAEILDMSFIRVMEVATLFKFVELHLAG